MYFHISCCPMQFQRKRLPCNEMDRFLSGVIKNGLLNGMAINDGMTIKWYIFSAIRHPVKRDKGNRGVTFTKCIRSMMQFLEFQF